MEKKTLNMTEGSPVKLLVVFAIPMMIGNIFQQMYNAVDSIIVGQLIGPDALAAIGTTGSVTFLFFALCNGIGSGGGIVTSQQFGAGNEKQIKKCLTNVAYLMMLFPTVVGIIAFVLSRSILIMINTDPLILDDAVRYLQVMSIGLVFVSLYNYISSMLRALGDSKTPLYFLIISCILNIGLDYLFVKTFQMGVVGAGVATLIAQFLSGFACVVYALRKNPYFKLQKDDWKFDAQIVTNAIKIGFPLSLQFSLIAISCIALQGVVNDYGKTATAAFAVTSRVEQIVHQPYQTLSAALSTYTGQNYGAHKFKRIKQGFVKSMMLMVGFTAIVVPVMQIFGGGIASIFVKEKEVIDMAAKGLGITSFFYLFLGVIYIVRGVLNGVGDAFFALINGITEVIGRFFVPVYMTGIASIGLWGIWWSVGIVWFMAGATAFLRYLWFNKKSFAKYEQQ